MSNEILNAIKQAFSSEHCSYKSTKKYLATLPTTGPSVIQGPGENAGIVRLSNDWALAIRIESHNHPSFIKPYHGAATGVGGILRDIFTMGARPIALLDFLRFGTNGNADYLREHVVRGIADYGNTVGVPVVGGDVYFDSTYNNNCLVNVACLGLVKEKNIIYGRACTPGNVLIYVGGRTGRDGVGGAQMASKNLNQMDESAIQDADPFLEKLLLEACCELAETDYIEGMQDMGAAGLLCSTSEVVLRGRKSVGNNLGVQVYLDRIPRKGSDMTPIELLLSESQERMLIVGKKDKTEEILNTFKYWDLEAVVIGQITNDNRYTLLNDTDVLMSECFDSLFPDIEQDWPLVEWEIQSSPHQICLQAIQREIWTQYDWTVGTRTIKGPNLLGRYAILDIPEIDKHLVITWGSDMGLVNCYPQIGTRLAFNLALEQMFSLGAMPLGLTNCLNFGHPKQSMGAFVEVTKVLAQQCKMYDVPVVSGNVSLYNAYQNHSIKPTVVIVMVGIK